MESACVSWKDGLVLEHATCTQYRATSFSLTFSCCDALQCTALGKRSCRTEWLRRAMLSWLVCKKLSCRMRFLVNPVRGYLSLVSDAFELFHCVFHCVSMLNRRSEACDVSKTNIKRAAILMEHTTLVIGMRSPLG